MTVIVAGGVAVILNLILPQEDPAVEDDAAALGVDIVDVEARDHNKAKE